MDALAVAEAAPPEASNTNAELDANLQEQVPEAENKFQKAIAAWRGMQTYASSPYCC